MPNRKTYNKQITNSELPLDTALNPGIISLKQTRVVELKDSMDFDQSNTTEEDE